MKAFVYGLIIVLCLALVLTGCLALSDNNAETPAPAAETGTAPAETPVPAPAGTAVPEETDGPLTKGVAVTVGDRDYSPAEVSYIYSMEYSNFANSYGMYYGLDTSGGAHGLSQQPYTGPETEGKSFATWRDFFLDASYTYLGQVQHLIGYAKDHGIALSEEELAEAESNLALMDSYAMMYGFSSVDEFLTTYFGEGITMEVMRTMEMENMLAGKAYTAFQEDLSFSEEELAEEYASFQGDYDNFRFALYTVKAAAGEDGEVTEEARAEAEAEADAIIMSYEDAEDVEDPYERLNGYIEEELGDSARLSENVAGRYIGSPYGEFLKDESRQAGDIAKLQNGDDFSVVLFLGRESGDYPTINIRHILIMAEQGEDGGWSEEALAAAKTEAERILSEWEEGERTEESFAALAEQYSMDGGSSSNGGLYEGVYKGQMVQEFNDFCFGGHQPGDTGIVYGSNGGYAGYHVMYFVGEGPSYGGQLAEQSLADKALTAWLDELPPIVRGPDEGLVDPASESD